MILKTILYFFILIAFCVPVSSRKCYQATDDDYRVKTTDDDHQANTTSDDDYGASANITMTTPFLLYSDRAPCSTTNNIDSEICVHLHFNIHDICIKI